MVRVTLTSSPTMMYHLRGHELKLAYFTSMTRNLLISYQQIVLLFLINCKIIKHLSYYKFWTFSNMVFTYSLFSWRISLLVLFPRWHRIWMMSHFKSNFWKTRLATHERCWRPSGNVRFSINYLQQIKQTFLWKMYASEDVVFNS